MKFGGKIGTAALAFGLAVAPNFAARAQQAGATQEVMTNETPKFLKDHVKDEKAYAYLASFHSQIISDKTSWGKGGNSPSCPKDTLAAAYELFRGITHEEESGNAMDAAIRGESRKKAGTNPDAKKFFELIKNALKETEVGGIGPLVDTNAGNVQPEKRYTLKTADGDSMEANGEQVLQLREIFRQSAIACQAL